MNLYEEASCFAYYGSAHVGHLYFFSSAAQTPQRGSDILVASIR
jgi:hypothetical protein